MICFLNALETIEHAQVALTAHSAPDHQRRLRGHDPAALQGGPPAAGGPRSPRGAPPGRGDGHGAAGARPAPRGAPAALPHGARAGHGDHHQVHLHRDHGHAGDGQPPGGAAAQRGMTGRGRSRDRR